MDTLNIVDEENIGSNVFHMKKTTEKNVTNVRKKTFKVDNAGNKLDKPIRSALMDLANIKKVETSELKPKVPSKQTSQQLKVSNSVNSISEFKEEWSDIEEMHIYEEPEDDYEDILPKHDRISVSDIENFWFPKSDFSQLPSSPERCTNASMDSYWMLTPPMLDESKFLDCDFFEEREMELVPLSLDYSDSEDSLL